MSDVGIFSGPYDTAILALLLGSPGLGIGLIVGALAWRRHRIWGALAGAVAGWALYFTGWLYFTDNL